MREDPFYQTKRWERIRLSILRRDGYQCQESKRYGKAIEANTVHHVFPREQYPRFTWCPWNLISLSAEQHNRMHDRENGNLTSAGKELLRRIAKKNQIKDYEEPW